MVQNLTPSPPSGGRLVFPGCFRLTAFRRVFDSRLGLSAIIGIPSPVLEQVIYVMLKPHMVVLLNQNILHGELLPSRPAHHRFRDLDALLIRQRDRQRERFPWSHGEIT